MLSRMGKFVGQRLKIAIVAPPWFPVPPVGYGGIEAVVSLLTEGLCRRGHQVTLFASGDSVTQAKLVSALEKAPNKKISDSVYLENLNSLAAYELAHEFDIIHDHDGLGSRLLGALTSRLLKKPVIATLHGPANEDSRGFYSTIANDLRYIAISESQRASFGDLNFLSTIPNAIKIDDYPFSSTPGNYLLFVGRMSEEKGAHIAVSVAKKLGMKLVMIGKCSEEQEKRYFDEKVRPIMDKNIAFYGEVDQSTKFELYKNALCTLFPIQWPEPFGLVMIESMACGTPVIGVRNGSVPEVIRHNQTGYIVNGEDDMVGAVKDINNIDRTACREFVEREYNEEAFIDRHESAYWQAIEVPKSDELKITAQRFIT